MDRDRVIIALQDQFSGGRIQDFIAKHDWNPKTEFHVAHVLEAVGPARHGDPSWVTARARAHTSASALVGEFAATIREFAPERYVREHVLEGRAAEELVRLAQAQVASVIIMGCRGRKGFQRLLLGSVSSDVASKAPCSVIILKTNKQAFARTLVDEKV